MRKYFPILFHKLKIDLYLKYAIMFSKIVMIIEIEYLLNNGTDILIIPLKGTEPPKRHRRGKNFNR